MNASFDWLRDFAPVNLTPQELRDVITARVATVDDVVPMRQDLAGVVIGRVVEAHRHPDSDHLWVTRVDAGLDEPLDVVCGAQNVTVGVKYPFAPVGTVLPGGLKLERRKIRGQLSNGMLCSARELGLGTDHEGILALDTTAEPGTPFIAAYEAGDTRLVIDVLPNRPDLLSHEGVGREIAAYTGAPLRLPMHDGMVLDDRAFITAATNAATSGVSVRVDADAACPVYCATVIRGVTVGPSPDWLVRRLEAVGARSINNVVDATNYMLHGFGQPMHAFDLAKLSGPAVRVRRARDRERIVTLDGVARELDASVTVIADESTAHAIAGVIGGEGSEVTSETRDILLEVAVFDARSVRHTRRALGVSTDASYRFERAVDASAVQDHARYAAALIRALAGGAIADAPVIIGAPVRPRESVELRIANVTRLLGDITPSTQCSGLLRSVGFQVEELSPAALRVTPPAWRSDVTLEADVIEEIARLRGYDTFSSELRPFRVGSAPDSAQYLTTRRVTRALVEAGLNEARPMPFVADAGENGVRVTNPLAESEAMLRSSVLQTLARRVEYNFAHMTRNVRLFEVGVAFTRGDGNIPVERNVAAAAITGDRYPAHFADPRPPQVDIWDARWIGEVMARAAFGANAVSLSPNAAGSGWTMLRDGVAVGSIAPLEVDAPVWAAPVFGIELDMTGAVAGDLPVTPYSALPGTPAAEFDLALVMPASVSADDVRRVVTATAGELLESLVPFDEFRGGGIPDGARSVAWRLTFRHPERTLRDKEIEGRRAKLLRALDEQLGVRPRTS